MLSELKLVPAFLLLAGLAKTQTQNAPNVSQVVVYSGVSSATRTGAGTLLPNAVPNIFSGTGDILTTAPLNNPSTFTPNGGVAYVAGVLNQSIATALSVIPISSPVPV